jgi:hypothetical protein
LEEVERVTSADFTLQADEGPEDLPRTFRREREAREREQRERDEKARAATLTHDFGASEPSYDRFAPAGAPAIVTRFDVPFAHLMMFFIKAVFAAVPALFILGVMLWLAGDVLRNLFPWLIKMQILIHFPN